MRATRGGASSVMIGRGRELRQLTQLASSRHPRLAVIAGEAGIGKTRLIQELLNRLPEESAVLLGHAEPGSLARPYEVLLDAIADRSDFDPELLDELVDAERSPVERLYTGLKIVSRLVGDRPAVIIFEDLHWADSESSALFERIADQTGPQLLIGTYRPDEVTSRHPVAALLGRLERRHEISHLGLERLGESDTAALLASVAGRPAPYRTVAALHQRTGGNPFFLEELLRGHETDDLDALCEQPLPWSLAEVLRRQVDDLPSRVQRIVEAAAVLGHRVPFDLLSSVTGAAEDELIIALRELVDGGVLVEFGDDEFSFRHALVREAISGRLLGRQRRRLHEIALETLLSSGGSDPAMIVHHARGAGRYGDMIDAARSGAALYLSIGSAYQALQLAEIGLDEAGEDTQLLAEAAQAAWLAGLLDDATGYARRWRQRAETSSERAEALYLLIKLANEADEIEEMDALAHEVERLVAHLPPRDQGGAMVAVAWAMEQRDQTDAALEWADKALALAQELGLPRVRLAALVEKGSALSARWATQPEGRDMLASVVDEAEKLGEWVLAARALHNVVNYLPPSSLTKHAQMLERMRVDAERGGFEALAVAAYYQGVARLAMHDGDLPAAIAAIERGRERERWYLRRGRATDYHGVFLAGLYLECGDLDRVGEIIEELRERNEGKGISAPGLDFHLACRRGDVVTAERVLDEIFAALAEQTWRSGSQAHDLVSAALFAGLPLSRLERMGAELIDAGVSDDYQRLVEAQLWEVRGQAGTALEGFGAVVDSSALPPSVRGTAHVGAARCLLGMGRRSEAVEHAGHATSLLSRWAGWRVDDLDHVRDQLGLAPPDGERAATGTAALTRREREVALLIADGLTNAELARRLYISPKTAAVHVSSILRKLGVSNRVEAAQAVKRG